MRWCGKAKSDPRRGEERIITRFIWFPKKLWCFQTDCHQWRWLEMSRICQSFAEPDWDYGLDWCDLAWALDKPLSSETDTTTTLP